MLNTCAFHTNSANLTSGSFLIGIELHFAFCYAGIFRTNSIFIGSNCRQAVRDGRGDFIPIFLREAPLLFRRGIINLDVALVTVSPPDEHGFCTLGTSIDTTLAAVQTAKYVIGKYSLLDH
jgi:4-hydroxybutyrate CoA-transferase